MIETDILIIGAGPTGLFTVFEAGLLKLRCHLLDALAQPGGQLSEIYPKKPIYDIPGYPSVLAGELVDNLMEQIAPFAPGFTLGEVAISIEKQEDGRFKVVTDHDTELIAPVIMIAGGLGCFEPRKPPIPNLATFERKGVAYMVRNPEDYRGKKLVLAGGGDSALDWSIFLSNVAAEITLIHRRTEFRGAPDSVEKVMHLAETGQIKLVTQAEVVELHGDEVLSGLTIRRDNTDPLYVECNYFIPLFGLSPQLGPLANWGLNIEKNAIEVNTADYSTNIPGIYAIGDINTYPGKLKLILCGFHEGTMAVQSAFSIIYPDKKKSFKYTTVTGIEGFPLSENAS
jgi:thioredoxin reductase (NADPH)